jgi:protein-L-isoaspartate(D-aspartate) O-methyltransferase
MGDKSPDAYRKALVAELKKQDGLLDNALEAAFLAVPRHLFLPKESLEVAYSDQAIPIKRDSDGSVLSSSSQPSMMAIMLRQLRLRKGDNVLEIGAGTGYNAAVMQTIVGDKGNVTSVELDKLLADKASSNLQKARLGAVVNIVNADGAMGYAPRAAYDRIIATVAVWDIPASWVKQLKQDGILVAPIWLESLQVSAAFVIQPDGSLYSRTNIPCGFIPLRGIASGPNITRRVSGSTLTLSSNEAEHIDGAALASLLSDDAETTFLSTPLTFSELWRGFVPYLTLNMPEGFFFATYSVGEQQKDFGLEGDGFALITRGSACFVRYQGKGEAHLFGGADALFTLQAVLDQWEKVGRPGADRIRIQLLPKNSAEPIEHPANTKVYARPYNELRVWMET